MIDLLDSFFFFLHFDYVNLFSSSLIMIRERKKQLPLLLIVLMTLKLDVGYCCKALLIVCIFIDIVITIVFSYLIF